MTKIVADSLILKTWYVFSPQVFAEGVICVHPAFSWNLLSTFGLILLDAVFPQSPSAEPSVVPNAITSYLLNDIHYKNCFFHGSCGL